MNDKKNELYHHGVPGQKWGVRKYQNEDGSYKPGAEGRYAQNGTGSGHQGSGTSFGQPSNKKSAGSTINRQYVSFNRNRDGSYRGANVTTASGNTYTFKTTDDATSFEIVGPNGPVGLYYHRGGIGRGDDESKEWLLEVAEEYDAKANAKNNPSNSAPTLPASNPSNSAPTLPASQKFVSSVATKPASQVASSPKKNAGSSFVKNFINQTVSAVTKAASKAKSFISNLFKRK